MRLLPKRALVALGLALCAVVVAAVPAGASNVLLWPNPGWSFSTNGPGGSVGYVNAFTDGTTNALSEQVTANKATAGDNSDEYTCTEVWTDWFLGAHRPADVFTNCRTNNIDNGILPIHWPSSNPNPFSPVHTWDTTVTSQGMKMAVCKVDVRQLYGNYDRTAGGNCLNGSHGGIGVVTNRDFEHASLGTIQANFGCGQSYCYRSGVSLMPEYINHGSIDLLGLQDWFEPGSLLVSWDGFHRFVMQHDGNLVLYNANNQATFNIGACLKPGKHLVAGSHAILWSDGNFVVYDQAGNWIWQSVSDGNTCNPLGVRGGAGNYLKMQNDGNMVEYYNGGVLWSTGTNGQ